MPIEPMKRHDEGVQSTPALRLTQTELNAMHSTYENLRAYTFFMPAAEQFCQLYERCRDLEKGYTHGNRHRLL